MIVKLLTEHHYEFLSLKGGCRGSSESTHVKMPHCWKSHALAHIRFARKVQTYGDAFSKSSSIYIYTAYFVVKFEPHGIKTYRRLL